MQLTTSQGKIKIVTESRNLPNIFDRISILSAAILLAYILAGFVSLPAQDLALQLPGFYLEIQINVQVVIAFLVAGLSATGVDWLVRDHPGFREKYTFQHWLLPALTAWAIGMALFQQPFGNQWWAIFVVGGGALILVLIAEYTVVDPTDVRQFPATIGLIALSFALYLILIITIRAIETRLFILLPTIFLATGLTSLRTLHLRLQGRWAFTHTAVIAIIIGQLSAALNYLPIEPVTFGLVLLGPAYALTSLVGGFLAGRNWRQAIGEPIFVLVIIGGIAIFVR